MKRAKLLTALSIIFSTAMVNGQIFNINTIAGNGTSGYSGDGAQATNAMLSAPYGVAVDASGNVYIPDDGNNRIRMVNTSGVITTVAGNGTGGFSGDAGQATNAMIKNPTGVVLDAAGNLYISDAGNSRIRMVNTSGIITTIAGTGVSGFSGDGGQATNAQLSFPCEISLDKSGNLYIPDLSNQRIRMVNTSGVMSTVAGNGTSGFSGDAGQATNAELANPFGVAIDGAGNLYIADQFNHRIRMVNTSGVINTIAGDGTGGYSGDGAPATNAELNRPFGVALDGFGDIFIADYANNRIRMVNGSGNISTVAGTGTAGFSGDGGPAISADLKGPSGISIDHLGNLYISDQSNARIRELQSTDAGINNLTSNNEVSVYPNPSHGIFTLLIKNLELNPSSNRDKNYVEVYNMLGERVYSSPLLQGTIDLSGNAKGVYLYRALTQAGKLISTGRLIIQ